MMVDQFGNTEFFPKKVVLHQISMRDLLNTFFFYWKTVVFVALVFSLAGGAVAVLAPPVYRADARLLTLYAGYYDMQVSGSANRTAPAFNPTQVVNVEAQLLEGAELHRSVVEEELGPSSSAEAIDKALRSFDNRFHLETIEDANVIELSYVDSDPHRAADVLDRLIKTYYRQRAGVFSTGRVAFLVAQRDKVRAQMDKANAQLVAFQEKYSVLDIDSQVSGAVSLKALLRQRAYENEASLSQDQLTLERLREEAKTVPQTVELFTDNTEMAHAVDTMHLSLLQLQSRRSDLASRYTKTSPFVVQMDKQIADVKRAIAERTPHLISAVRTGHNSYYDTVQDRITRLSSDLKGEAGRKKKLEEQISDVNRKIDDLIRVQNQFHRMEIDRDLLIASFKQFSQELEQARIEENQVNTSNSTNVRIIQAPEPPIHRSNPPYIFVLIGISVGILAGGLAMLIRSTLRESFLSPEEVERRLGLPVLCAPMSPNPSRRKPYGANGKNGNR